MIRRVSGGLNVLRYSYCGRYLRPPVTLRQSQSRWMSLGNPMFPEPKKPDFPVESTHVPTIDKKDLPEHLRKDQDNADQSFLARHGGKVALIAFALAGVLIYGFFKGNSNKSDAEDRILQEEPLEPYEVKELRFSNISGRYDKPGHRKLNVTVRHLRDIMRLCNDYVHSSSSGTPMILYTDFIQVCNQVLVSKDSKSDGISLESGYLFDRLVRSRAVSASGQETYGEMQLGDMMIPIGLGMTMLSIVCTGSNDDRVEALFRIAKEYGRGSRQMRTEGVNEDRDLVNDYVTYSDFIEIIQYLVDSCQLPAEKKVVQKKVQPPDSADGTEWMSHKLECIVRWFLPKEYTVKNATEIGNFALSSEAEKKKLDLTYISLPPKDMTTLDAGNDSSISWDNFRALLLGTSICVWGECYGHYYD